MGATKSLPDDERYVAVHDSARFKDLRRKWQVFTLRATVTFVGWWFLSIGLGAFRPSFYTVRVVGSLNVGLIFVLVTFALVLVIITSYLRYARTRMDPLGEQIRADLEGDLR